MAIKHLKEVTIPIPVAWNIGTPWINAMILQKEVDLYMKRESTYATGKATMFAVILVQCTEAMKSKLKPKDTFKEISEQSNMIYLLLLICGIAYNYKLER